VKYKVKIVCKIVDVSVGVGYSDKLLFEFGNDKNLNIVLSIPTHSVHVFLLRQMLRSFQLVTHYECICM